MKEVPRDDKWDGEGLYSHEEIQEKDWVEGDPNGDDGETGAEDAGADPQADTSVSADTDPFAPGNVEVVTAITLMRIYDVMLAEFIQKYPAAGDRLLNKHRRGGFMGPPPAFDPAQAESYEE